MLKSLLPSSYLVMPFMQTDLQKIMGMEFSEDKVQYLVYQMLKGLKVSVACMVAKSCSVLRPGSLWGGGGEEGLAPGWELGPLTRHSLSLSPFQYIHSAGVVHRVSELPLPWFSGTLEPFCRVWGRNWALWWPIDWEQ